VSLISWLALYSVSLSLCGTAEKEKKKRGLALLLFFFFLLYPPPFAWQPSSTSRADRIVYEADEERRQVSSNSPIFPFSFLFYFEKKNLSFGGDSDRLPY
jgi:hypothetical protein